MKRLILLLTPIILMLCACDSNQQSTSYSDTTTAISRDVFAMDTYMNIKVYSNNEDILDASEEKILQLESMLSVTSEGSDVWNINHSSGEAVSVDDETATILKTALDVCDSTNGALDVSVYPLLAEWGFTTNDYKVPTQERIDTLLDSVDYRNVHLDGSTVTIPTGYQIDLGSVAKGYTSDCLMEIFKNNNVQSAIVSLGGNVQAYGTKPDGSLWNVAVRNPFSPNEDMCIVSIEDKAVITSGNYERYFTDDDGNTYWHILDTSTGYPADNGLVSVTIIGNSGIMCDALSTALFVMGTEKSIEYWKDNQNFGMILVTDDRKIYVTEDLQENFNNISSMDFEVINYE